MGSTVLNIENISSPSDEEYNTATPFHHPKRAHMTGIGARPCKACGQTVNNAPQIVGDGREGWVAVRVTIKTAMMSPTKTKATERMVPKGLMLDWRKNIQDNTHLDKQVCSRTTKFFKAWSTQVLLPNALNHTHTQATDTQTWETCSPASPGKP